MLGFWENREKSIHFNSNLKIGDFSRVLIIKKYQALHQASRLLGWILILEFAFLLILLRQKELSEQPFHKRRRGV